MRSVSQAQGALRELARLLPDTAVRIVGERTEEVKASTTTVAVGSWIGRGLKRGRITLRVESGESIVG
jgi:cation transport ATPase